MKDANLFSFFCYSNSNKYANFLSVPAISYNVAVHGLKLEIGNWGEMKRVYTKA
jgi:hypothetical protein